MPRFEVPTKLAPPGNVGHAGSIGFGIGGGAGGGVGPGGGGNDNDGDDCNVGTNNDDHQT